MQILIKMLIFENRKLEMHKINQNIYLLYLLDINFDLNKFNLVHLIYSLKRSMEAPGIDPGTSRMLSERSTIWATPPP